MGEEAGGKEDGSMKNGGYWRVKTAGISRD